MPSQICLLVLGGKQPIPRSVPGTRLDERLQRKKKARIASGQVWEEECKIGRLGQSLDEDGLALLPDLELHAVALAEHLSGAAHAGE